MEIIDLEQEDCCDQNDEADPVINEIFNISTHKHGKKLYYFKRKFNGDGDSDLCLYCLDFETFEETRIPGFEKNEIDY